MSYSLTLSQVKIERFPEDIAKISEQVCEIQQLENEVGYLKQELIEARAMKSASDDELGTVKGKLETLENSMMSLSNEGVSILSLCKKH